MGLSGGILEAGLPEGWDCFDLSFGGTPCGSGGFCFPLLVVSSFDFDAAFTLGFGVGASLSPQFNFGAAFFCSGAGFALPAGLLFPFALSFDPSRGSGRVSPFGFDGSDFLVLDPVGDLRAVGLGFPPRVGLPCFGLPCLEFLPPVCLRCEFVPAEFGALADVSTAADCSSANSSSPAPIPGSSSLALSLVVAPETG